MNFSLAHAEMGFFRKTLETAIGAEFIQDRETISVKQ